MARAEREEKSTERSEQEPAEKKKGVLLKWAVIGLAALLVAGGIAGGAYYYFGGKKQDAVPTRNRHDLAYGTIYYQPSGQRRGSLFETGGAIGNIRSPGCQGSGSVETEAPGQRP